MAHRPFANTCEEKFAQLARHNGWQPVKRGWPDFLCFGPYGELIAVEVKPRTKDGRRMKIPKREQVDALNALTAVGVRCYLSDGDVLEKWDPERHAPNYRRRNGRRI